MVNLILAIVCSASIATFMRLGEKQIKNNMVMFLANYTLCMLLSYAFMPEKNIFKFTEGAPFAIGLGLLEGFLFLMGFVMLQFNIKKNGVVLASTFMRLGVLVPIVIALVVFREKIDLLQGIGFALALVAIVVVNRDPNSAVSGDGKGKIWLIVLLLMGGLTDALMNIYDKMGAAAHKDLFLMVTFLAAMVISFILIFVKKQKFTVPDILWGLLIGIPNYFGARFLLHAVGQMPATVVYPVYNAATILVVTMIGVFAFKEKLSKTKIVGLLIIVASIVLLNI